MRILSLIFVLLCSEAIGASSPKTAPFVDGTKKLGLTLGNGAAAWADINNDGWVDLLTGGVLWKNNKGKGFSRIFQGGHGIFADFDNDGYLDLFCFPAYKLFRNIKGKEFKEIALPDLPGSVSRGACWADVNGDGHVDLYVGGYEDWNRNITYPDRILLNHGGKSLSQSWTETRYRARGVTACDFDRDGDMDVYVSNYRLLPNLLWRNDGKGNFADTAKAHNAVATSEGFGGGHSIGAAWGDFNNDGHMDLFAGNFAHRDGRGDQPKSRFLCNRGPEADCAFEDRGTCGVHYQESYASPAVGDYDNDGDLDLLFTTVYRIASFGKPNFPVLYRNDGDWTFTDVTEESGLGRLPATYQAAWADFDNDGDLDLVSGGKLFVNGGNENHWLKVRLEGRPPHVNRAAIGTQVRIQIGEQTLTRHVEAGTGEGNQNDLALHFGLAKRKGPLQLEIFWPGGTVQIIKNVKANQTISVTSSNPTR